MKTGDPTPDEAAELLALQHALGFDTWPSDEIQHRCLNWIRVRELKARRAVRSAEERIRIAHKRKQEAG